MRARIVAVGRARGGPEADMAADYARRFGRAGRPLGLGPLEIVEVDDRKGGGPAAEAVLIARALGAGPLVALDERGDMMSSPDLARRLAQWRDAGQPCAHFVIGGADGLEPGMRARADLTLSFGPMVWPHMLARVMLAEQLYRAATILAGSPYHRA